MCHVIVRNRSSLSMGSRGVAAGANPSLVSGRGQGTPWTPAHRRALTDEQCGVQYLAQGHFDMQLSPARRRAECEHTVNKSFDMISYFY